MEVAYAAAEVAPLVALAAFAKNAVERALVVAAALVSVVAVLGAVLQASAEAVVEARGATVAALDDDALLVAQVDQVGAENCDADDVLGAPYAGGPSDVAAFVATFPLVLPVVL